MAALAQGVGRPSMRARRSRRSCVWRVAEDQKGFVKIGYPERVVSQTQSGTYVIGVPRGADHPQKNRQELAGSRLRSLESPSRVSSK